MLKKNLTKILSTAIIFAVLIGIVITISSAAVASPEMTLNEAEELLPDVIFGSKGENFLPNNVETDGESEDDPPKENMSTEIPESIPEMPKEEQSETNQPNIDKVTEESGGDTAGSGEGDVSGEGEPGEVTVVTDLENKIVTSSELSGDMFEFFAYIENGSEKHSLTINFKNSETSFSGENLETADDYYEAKLALGANYFTIYLEEDGKTVSSVQYIITYQAAKADASNPNVGEGISIVTNLDGYDEVMTNRYFTFTVSARSSGKVIYSDHIEVTLDGTTVDSPTGSSTFEYVLNFGPEDTHLVTVLAWDDEGNSAYREYEVKFKGSKDGDSIGVAYVVIDATAAGLGIIGEYEVEILQGDTAAKSLVSAADFMGLSIHYDGNTESGFYVRGVSGFGGVPEVPAELWECILRDGLSLTGAPSGGLFSGDFTANSGWMYSINGTLYPGKGLSAYNLSDGDTIYLRYTVAEGKDIGGSGGGNGNLAGYCGIWSDGGYYELEHEYVEIDRGTDYIEYECAICEKHYTEEIIPEEPEEHEHEYYEVDRVEPTETEDGYVIYECECGDWYEEVLPATGAGDEEDFEEGSEEDEENS
ncbi:MAG: DUF4430 domain-containing protein [Oscillospiraceae bacterium]|nr:DUF4430 domain-containing protein [Oscillospiraceae bacterium]